MIQKPALNRYLPWKVNWYVILTKDLTYNQKTEDAYRCTLKGIINSTESNFIVKLMKVELYFIITDLKDLMEVELCF